jgi:hypothetical protein
MQHIPQVCSLHFTKLYCYLNVLAWVTRHTDAPRDQALSCARDGLERSACWVVGVHVMAREQNPKQNKYEALPA